MSSNGFAGLPPEIRRRHPTYLRDLIDNSLIPDAPDKPIGDMTMRELDVLRRKARERKNTAFAEHQRWHGSYQMAHRLEEALTAIMYDRRWMRARRQRKAMPGRIQRQRKGTPNKEDRR